MSEQGRKIEELSASSIKTYNRCEKRFWYKYVLDIEPPDTPEPDFFKTGNAVHETIENVLNEHGVVADEDELLKILKREENTLDYNYQDNKKVENCFETASRWIPSFLENIHHIEEKWDMDKSGINFRGLADVVGDVNFGSKENGDIIQNVIIDWKTGNVYDAGSEDKEERKKAKRQTWEEKIQAGMYIEMFHEKFGEYPDAAVFVYLNEETQSVHRRIRDGEVYWNEHENKYWTEINEHKNKILKSKQKENWPARPDSKKCYHCAFRLRCEDSPVGAETVEPRHIEMGDI